MKRIGLLVLMVAALGVTSLMADHKEGVRGRGGRFGAGAFRNGNGRGTGLPPGLQRRVDRTGQLPPGLQRRVDRTGQLPPGLQRRRGGRFTDRGGFVGRDRPRGRDRQRHSKFHQGLRERHSEFHERYFDLDDPDARRSHRRFHGRKQNVHREAHQRRSDRGDNGFGRRHRRSSRRVQD